MTLPTELGITNIKHLKKIEGFQYCYCRGETHLVYLINGKIVLANHNLALEQAMLDLGGEPCRCMRLYYALRKRDTGLLSGCFQKYIDEARRKVGMRKARLLRPIRFNFREDIKPPQSIQHLVKLLIKYRCHYNIPAMTFIDVTSTGARPYVQSTWSYKYDIGGEQYLSLHVNIPHNWKETVYDNRFAVVDGHLVLSNESKLDSFGDHTVTIMASGKVDIPDDNDNRYGIRNATIMYAYGKYRMKYMDTRTFYHRDYGHGRGWITV